MQIWTLLISPKLFFLLSVEGSLVGIIAYIAFHLGGTPSQETVTSPLAVCSSTTIYLCILEPIGFSQSFNRNFPDFLASPGGVKRCHKCPKLLTNFINVPQNVQTLSFDFDAEKKGCYFCPELILRLIHFSFVQCITIFCHTL